MTNLNTPLLLERYKNRLEVYRLYVSEWIFQDDNYQNYLESIVASEIKSLELFCQNKDFIFLKKEFEVLYQTLRLKPYQ